MYITGVLLYTCMKVLLDNVVLEQREKIKITIETLKEVFGWDSNTYINIDGNLCTNHPVHTSHKLIDSVEIIRKANEDDFILQNILPKLLIWLD